MQPNRMEGRRSQHQAGGIAVLTSFLLVVAREKGRVRESCQQDAAGEGAEMESAAGRGGC